ncbi:hypothetical protein BS47DRAFT_1350459, partial [Hydnum rufescens UP504]
MTVSDPKSVKPRIFRPWTPSQSSHSPNGTRLHASPLYYGQVGAVKYKHVYLIVGSFSDEHCRPGRSGLGILYDVPVFLTHCDSSESFSSSLILGPSLFIHEQGQRHLDLRI